MKRLYRIPNTNIIESFVYIENDTDTGYSIPVSYWKRTAVYNATYSSLKRFNKLSQGFLCIES